MFIEVALAVFRLVRVAVFVDGCFWHGCRKHSKLPANNRPFWRKKMTANRARDRLVNRTLRRLGWRVVRVWEHDLNLTRRGGATVRRRILKALGRYPADFARTLQNQE